ncbi:MAG: DNA polymerase Y family protein [Bacteroidota bacterium]|nr:DNA polymerase Y family protein [Bacteroidota bacterium]
MSRRNAVIWFPHLVTDRLLRKQPELKDIPFVLVVNERGRRVVKAINALAQEKGIRVDMVLADCKALLPELTVCDYDEAEPKKLLTALAEWCIRYSPFISIDLPDVLILDVSGCTHLWGGEQNYLNDIHKKFNAFGYTIRSAMADTIGTAWAVCHFGNSGSIIETGKEVKALTSLPNTALRLEPSIIDKLDKLGLKTIGSFITMPSSALKRRFGQSILKRLAQALGEEMEITEPVLPVTPFQKRLPSLEPIRTAEGIEIAIKTLLQMLCERLQQEMKGLRKCTLTCYRLDGVVVKTEIGTSKPSRNTLHLYKLFENKISQIEPDLGIELFVMDALVVEELHSSQDALWTVSGKDESVIAELLDRLSGKTGVQAIHRYLPAEHYWPERSFKNATSLSEKPSAEWRTDLPRPLHILPVPELIEVSVPIPDYPPLLFRYKGVIHNVKKADGPERIEQEWWLQQGLYRDYYCVEDDHGSRYWLFRSGDYDSGNVKWFIHGFFT